MSSVINNLLGKREGLSEKWWHRFLKVVYFLSLAVVFLIAFAIASNSVTPTNGNTTVINNLRDFAASSDNSIVNTVPGFLEINGELGCYHPETNKITYASEYFIEKSFCSYDIVSRADDAVSFYNKEYPGANYTRNDLFEKIFNKDTEKRYCLINKDVDCQSKNIVKYNKTALFYAEAGLYSLLTVLIWGLFWMLFYNRVFLYIIYGSKKKLN